MSRENTCRTSPKEQETKPSCEEVRQKETLKIIDKINECLEHKQVFYSFEYFPPKTPAGVQNLFHRMQRMMELNPLFLNVTSSSSRNRHYTVEIAAGSQNRHYTVEIAAGSQNVLGLEAMMHLTCAGRTEQEVKSQLDTARRVGIRNLMIIRGDVTRRNQTCPFQHAIDLVRYVRQTYGHYFCICVAGYPESHPESEGPEEDMKWLKSKVEAGADMIMSQIFFDTSVFIEWVQACRDAGISCPIIPGIMPIQSYSFFEKCSRSVGCRIPAQLRAELKQYRSDDNQIKMKGIEYALTMCRQLLANDIPGFHLYTLNLDHSVTAILEGLGLVVPRTNGSLPWVQSREPGRQSETVRPIYWANRPQSYLDRSKAWDEYPNGRWGDSTSPAFGQTSAYHLVSFNMGTEVERRRMWGTPTVPLDVFRVFNGYLTGTVPYIPWCEAKVHLETVPLVQTLSRLNLSGFLTINSQPRVNAAPSSDPAVGWGGPGGYVYQKAYLEFFASPSNLQKIVRAAREHPNISYDAADAQGNLACSQHVDSDLVNALTWGVFPNKEIIQPTIASHKSFLIWKDEAFALWRTQWMSVYPRDSASYRLLNDMIETYYLVTVVDNDYIGGDLFAFFQSVM